MKGIEYRGFTSVDGPIVIVRRTENIFYLETVCVRDRNGNKRIGRVMDLSEDADESELEQLEDAMALNY